MVWALVDGVKGREPNCYDLGQNLDVDLFLIAPHIFSPVFFTSLHASHKLV